MADKTGRRRNARVGVTTRAAAVPKAPFIERRVARGETVDRAVRNARQDARRVGRRQVAAAQPVPRAPKRRKRGGARG